MRSSLSWGMLGALTGLILGLSLGLMLTAAVAQSLPTPPAPTCEQQLDQAQRTILQLRKANAQSDFQAASLQETLMDLQKKQAEAAKATEKAQAEKK